MSSHTSKGKFECLNEILEQDDAPNDHNTLSSASSDEHSSDSDEQEPHDDVADAEPHWDESLNILNEPVLNELIDTVIFPGDDNFSQVLYTTITFDGILKNVRFTEDKLINVLQPTAEIPRVICNFGEVKHPTYIPVIPKQASSRGRKKKPPQKQPRKKQGTGKCFNSQVSFYVLKNEYINGPLKSVISARRNQCNPYYQLKVFRNGKIQIPGIKPHQGRDIIRALYAVTNILNQAIPLLKLFEKYTTYDVDNGQLMLNDKIAIIDSTQEITHLIPIMKYPIKKSRKGVITPVAENEEIATIHPIVNSTELIPYDGGNNIEIAAVIEKITYDRTVILCPANLTGFTIVSNIPIEPVKPKCTIVECKILEHRSDNQIQSVTIQQALRTIYFRGQDSIIVHNAHEEITENTILCVTTVKYDGDVHPIKLSTVMKNYKFYMKIKPKQRINLVELHKMISVKMTQSSNVQSECLTIREVDVKLNKKRQTNLSITFSVPNSFNKSKFILVKVYRSGKINILGGLNTKDVFWIFKHITSLLLNNRTRLIVLENMGSGIPIEPTYNIADLAMSDEEVMLIYDHVTYYKSINLF